ncbi:hypothetical protein [Streptomyces sp. cmx-4-7]|uniref:hypothetical protein n=1 Tax=Streptomyces sp. cmx-4-7 TaxID=2790939 RepID=UPI00397ED8CF
MSNQAAFRAGEGGLSRGAPIMTGGFFNMKLMVRQLCTHLEHFIARADGGILLERAISRPGMQPRANAAPNKGCSSRKA